MISRIYKLTIEPRLPLGAVGQKSTPCEGRCNNDHNQKKNAKCAPCQDTPADRRGGGVIDLRESHNCGILAVHGSSSLTAGYDPHLVLRSHVSGKLNETQGRLKDG
jgi:hypothetical protein